MECEGVSFDIARTVQGGKAKWGCFWKDVYVPTIYAELDAAAERKKNNPPGKKKPQSEDKPSDL